MSSLAPIAVFVYKRPEHAARALASLLANPEIDASALTVYCDGARNGADAEAVARTRAEVRRLVPAHARVVERERNLGLAASIIAGVSELCDAHGRAIVVEDDLVLSHRALAYFNAALDRYAEEDRVMHVSGYMFPVAAPLPPAFFYREATCWGWATWARAWRHFEPDADAIARYVEERGLRSRFDVNDTMYFWEMLRWQREGRIDSWAIRWYGSLFMRDGLALHPARSLVRNEGFDRTGEHCTQTDEFEVELTHVIPPFPERIEESAQAVQAMMRHRRQEQRRATVRERVVARLRRLAARLRGRQ